MPIVQRLLRARRSRQPLVRRSALELLALYGIDWPDTVEVGPGLVLQHRALGTVVHPWVRIGADVTVFHRVTLGDRAPWEPRPGDHRPRVIVEDGAVLCAGAVVLGSPERPTIVGRDTVVGANAVLTRSTGVGEIWAGNPARCLGARDRATVASPAAHDQDRAPVPIG
ncbi:hypothetical protein [Actinomycetospora termitidis]|uniref:Serine O-acetyltransferase n=1 Tax=Actinomycetospora termitidis TaxID=3053470 RepID=A0ABT7M760_9PSEU|nr:hypothetical protein [Actinomycetospora sp. Odt1-22]MDL5155877.1 hypothetical protein [Actinomycetospora sp. Odt1-22]